MEAAKRLSLIFEDREPLPEQSSRADMRRECCSYRGVVKSGGRRDLMDEWLETEK